MKPQRISINNANLCNVILFFHGSMNNIFKIKYCDMFSCFCLNVGFGRSLDLPIEPVHPQSSFELKQEKNTPANSTFKKVWFSDMFITWVVDVISAVFCHCRSDNSLWQSINWHFSQVGQRTYGCGVKVSA